MFHMPRLWQSRRNINNRRQRINSRCLTDRFNVVHAVLQTHYDRIGVQMRDNGARCRFIVQPLHTKEDYIGASNRGRIGGSFYRHLLLKRNRVQK